MPRCLQNLFQLPHRQSKQIEDFVPQTPLFLSFPFLSLLLYVHLFLSSRCKNITEFSLETWNNFTCEANDSGRYITVFLAKKHHLILCEVEIYGTIKGTRKVLFHKVSCLFSAGHTYSNRLIARDELIPEISPLQLNVDKNVLILEQILSCQTVSRNPMHQIF